MRELRFGYALGYHKLEEIVRQGILAERYGFDTIWFPDHFVATEPTTICPEPWSMLAAIGFKTKHAMLSTGVTDPSRRHPATIAQTVATLDHLLKSRMMLGIGVGEYMNLVPYGVESPKIGQLKEAIECIRLLWTATYDKPANYKGEFFKLNNAFLTIRPLQKPTPPIYIGALGRRTRELVGEIADGWYPWVVAPRLYGEDLKDIERGTKRSGRSLDEIDTAARFFTAVSDNYDPSKSALEWRTKQALVLERSTLKRLGYDISIPWDLSVQRSISKEEVASAVGDMARSIPMDAVEAVSVFGSVENCISRIEELLKVGAKHIVVYNVSSNIDETLRLYGEEIIPYFKERQK